MWFKQESNTGDDVAGLVEAVGPEVAGFSKGDRVAGFHVMMTHHGSFAEYAVLPASTTFHVPSNISMEEAATIPLAAYTAAVATNYQLGLPSPWEKPPGNSRAVLVYGMSTAIGAYALKILKHAGVHPVVGVGSKNSEFVKPLLSEEKGDAFVDYTQFDSHDELAEELARVLKKTGADSFCAFDCVTEGGTHVMLGKALAAAAAGKQALKPALTLCLPSTDVSEVDASVEVTTTSVGLVHKEENNGLLFGSVWTAALVAGLRDGWFTPHPYEVVQGLENVGVALKGLRDGKVRGKKMVIRVAEGN